MLNLQMIDFEPGYTPGNLRLLRQKFNLTQLDVAILTDSKLRAVQRWEADFSVKNHSDMPALKWSLLLEKVAGQGGATPLG